MTAMTPAPPASQLTTPRLVLRPPGADDRDRVVTLLADRRIAATTVRIPHPYSGADYDGWLERCERGSVDGVSLALLVAPIDAPGDVVGGMGVTIETEYGVGELGFWIGVPFWSMGYASEAAAAVVSYCFGTLNLQRLQAHCFDGNVGSQRVLEKIGMRREGVMRRRVRRFESYHDTLHYALLREDERPTAAPGASR